jgi:ABC-type branched-subunit amino acid transport system substrate-binding protein
MSGLLKRIVWSLVGLAALFSGVTATADTATPAAAAASSEAYGRTPREYQPFGNFTQPYKRFFLEANEYHGYGRHIPEPQSVPTVKIGFLGPIEPTVSVATGGMSHEEPLGRKMLQGARLAIEHANQRGGYRDRIPFELVVRNDNGLWGASGSEVIDLAYKEGVWAILGSIDGANSHIAIRTALKIEIVVMNSGDTDPTFIETAIPWAFRCITDDRQMCYLMADFVFKELKLTRVAALRANNRYGRIGIDEFRDAATRLGYPFLAELNYQVGDTDFSVQLMRLKKLAPQAIITYGDATESGLILRQMRDMGMQQWFIGSDRIVSPEFIAQAGPQAGNVAAAYPYDPASPAPMAVEFRQAFANRFGEAPESFAAHAYDGMAMLIAAIERGGLNRAKIRDALADMRTYEGVTGIKQFDAIFNNISPAYLAVLEQGRFNILSQDEVFK